MVVKAGLLVPGGGVRDPVNSRVKGVEPRGLLKSSGPPPIDIELPGNVPGVGLTILPRRKQPNFSEVRLSIRPVQDKVSPYTLLRRVYPGQDKVSPPARGSFRERIPTNPGEDLLHTGGRERIRGARRTTTWLLRRSQGEKKNTYRQTPEGFGWPEGVPAYFAANGG